MNKMFLIVSVVLILLCSCSGEYKPQTPSAHRGVYHWKTTYNPTDWEKKWMKDHKVDKLYVKLFDVEPGSKNGHADYSMVDNPKIKHGRALTDADGIQHRKVCVIGKRIAEELFPNLENPCGEFLRIDSINYCIIGVSGKGSGGINIGGNPQTTVYLPYETMRQMYNRGNEVDILLTFTGGPAEGMKGYKAVCLQKEGNSMTHTGRGLIRSGSTDSLRYTHNGTRSAFSNIAGIRIYDTDGNLIGSYSK